MVKLYVEDVALEIVKTLITSDQRELIDTAANDNISTVKGISIAAFEFADAFIETYNERYVK